MSEADDLARRFFDLWAEYLTALLSEPQRSEPLRQWLATAAGALPDLLAGEPGSEPPGPQTGAAAVAAASGERDAAVAELARRIDELAGRVAALEGSRQRRRRPTGSARRRDPTPGS